MNDEVVRRPMCIGDDAPHHADALRILILLFSSFIIHHSSFAQSTVRPAYDLLAFKGINPDSVRVDLYLAVPYQMLEFIFVGDKYVGEYAATLQISEGDRTLIDRYHAFTVLETPFEHQTRNSPG